MASILPFMDKCKIFFFCLRKSEKSTIQRINITSVAD